MAFTTEQQQAIDARGANLLVSASAGSGKTTVMIRRILSLLENNSLDDMVICTFSRASAADMRDKLQVELMLRAEMGDRHAEEQLLLLPGANISTIHSWCQKLIRTYFYALDGVDPAFDILDEGEAEAYLNAAVDEAIDEAYASGDAAFSMLSDIMLSGRNDNNLKDIILKTFRYARVQSDPERWLGEGAAFGQNNPSVVLKMEEDAYSAMRDRLMRRAEELRLIVYQAGVEKLYEIADGMIAALEKCDMSLCKAVGSRKVDDVHAMVKENVKSLRAEIKAYVDKRNELAELPVVSGNGDFVNVIIRLVRVTSEKYAAVKQKKAMLDYEDLEHYACELMKNDEIRAEIMKKCKYVFVDEYQDTNPVQDSIISAVTGKDNLFLVGDVKQSIYAFRNCDPSIFVDKYVNHDKYGIAPPIELNANFRSHGQILDFANKIFSPVMTEDFGKVDYANTAKLVRGRELTSGEVKLNLVVTEEAVKWKTVYSVENGDVTDHSSQNTETDMVVANILQQLRTGKVVSEGKERKVECGDIAVLYGKRGVYVDMLCEKLKRAGINACVNDTVEFSSVYEVSVLQQFMRYVTCFTDDIALVGVLSSPAYKLSNDDLAQIKLTAEYGNNDFYAACRNYAAAHNDDIANTLNEFFADMKRYRTLSHTLTAAELVGKFVSEKKWFLHALSGDNATTRADAISAFLQSMADNKSATSVREYVEYLNKRGDSFSRPPMQNAVSIMTIHASKGLEFPFVHLIGTSSSFRRDTGAIQRHKTLGISIPDYDLTRHKKRTTRLAELTKLLNRREQNEERMRLLYVALTRAEQSINVYAVASSADKVFEGNTARMGENAICFFDWLRPAYVTYGFKKEYEREWSDIDEQRVDSAKVDEKAITAAAKEYFGFEYAYAQKPFKSSVTAMNRDRDEGEVKHYIGEADDRAAKRGTAYHLAMEKVDFAADFEAEWQRLVAYPEIAEWVNKEDVKCGVESLRTVVYGEGYFSAPSELNKLYREQEFVYNMGGTLVQGVIDLLIVNGDECVLVDYKTSSLTTIESGAYDVQMAVYMGAARDILGLKPTRILIYCFPAGKFIEISCENCVKINDKIKKTL